MLNHFGNRTKIICSLDSSSLSNIDLNLLDYGKFDALRLVYSEPFKKTLLEFLTEFERVKKKRNLNTAIILDLSERSQGFVLGEEETTFHYQQEVSLVSPGAEKGDLTIDSPSWEQTFKEGARAYLGSGQVIMRFVNTKKQSATAVVEKGGVIRPGDEVKVPETLDLPNLFDLSDLDLNYLDSVHLDFVILPGFSSSREFRIIRKKIERIGAKPPNFIFRVDTNLVLNNLSELLKESQGLMISRRDLSLTLEPETIPMICKEVTQEANKHAKLVFIASHLLSSMKLHPTPTRAEVSDIANAVIDGADAVVMSEGISKGSHLNRALEVCSNTVRSIEKGDVKINWSKPPMAIQNEFEAVTYHAYKTAERLNAKAIVCLTKGGNTALQVASYRPPIPIVALTFSSDTKRFLKMVRGVFPILLEEVPKLDKVLTVSDEVLRVAEGFQEDDLYVFITVTLSPISVEASNLFVVRRIEKK